ncbi:MAG: dihydropteroate synthase [Methylococcales bacterium]|jgi:dihydropteroate synthase|nr:dihydropteroate synthase [Methylococcales bacterium]MBT7443995.1 dihydropteroate synthase [Methylococcales bacterium]
MKFKCGDYSFDLSSPVVMGVLNVTPDSFSDGGMYREHQRAFDYAMKMAADGAGIIDVGGESTRPGAKAVSVNEELERVIPVISELAGSCGVPISIDTTKPEVMREAIVAGAALVNDVNALRSEGAVEVVSSSQVGVCLMHMQRKPETMQQNPQYENVVEEVGGFLQRRVTDCVEAGIDVHRIAVDPGFGFGKSYEHNVSLFSGLDELVRMGYPVLAGVSRKSMLGEITGLEANERLIPSVVAAVMAVARGCQLVRVHDVAETVQALSVYQSLK